jgi:hypothetical protein
VQFAGEAGGFVLWTKETVDDIDSTHFGFTLEEVGALPIAELQ